MYDTLVFSCLVKCVPYSEEACRNTAGRLGLNFRYAKHYATKGCFTYANGKVYYGIGGTEAQMMASPEAPKYRPNGYDCNEGKV